MLSCRHEELKLVIAPFWLHCGRLHQRWLHHCFHAACSACSVFAGSCASLLVVKAPNYAHKGSGPND